MPKLLLQKGFESSRPIKRRPFLLYTAEGPAVSEDSSGVCSLKPLCSWPLLHPQAFRTGPLCCHRHFQVAPFRLHTLAPSSCAALQKKTQISCHWVFAARGADQQHRPSATVSRLDRAGYNASLVSMTGYHASLYLLRLSAGWIEPARPQWFVHLVPRHFACVLAPSRMRVGVHRSGFAPLLSTINYGNADVSRLP